MKNAKPTKKKLVFAITMFEEDMDIGPDGGRECWAWNGQPIKDRFDKVQELSRLAELELNEFEEYAPEMDLASVETSLRYLTEIREHLRAIKEAVQWAPTCQDYVEAAE